MVRETQTMSLVIMSLFLAYSYLKLSEVLAIVLKAPAHLQYQLAFLSTVSTTVPNPTSLMAVGTPRYLPRLLPQPRSRKPRNRRQHRRQTKAHRRRLSRMFHGIRGQQGKHCVVPGGMREQHPQDLLREMGRDAAVAGRRALRVLVSMVSSMSLGESANCCSVASRGRRIRVTSTWTT